MSTQAPQVTPLPRWRQWVQWGRDNLDLRMFFWITLAISGYLFFGVPQITNIWMQGPPRSAVVVWHIAYWGFMVFLFWFVVSSWLGVLGSPFLPPPPRSGGRASAASSPPSLPRLLLRGLVWFFFLPVELASGWLVYLATPPECLSSRWGWFRSKVCLFLTSPFTALVLTAAGLVALFSGAPSDSNVGYPLIGAFCRSLGLILAGIGVWLLFHKAAILTAGAPPTGGWYVGRLLGWLVVTTCFGELLWVLACLKITGKVFSYRLYTNWAVVQALTILILVGLLIDCLWGLFRNWPIRQFAGIVLLAGVWVFSRAEVLSSGDAEHCMTPDQVDKVRQYKPTKEATKKDREKRNNFWFDHFLDRVRLIPPGEGPVVLVAASGGGSRAAIFTAATLEALRRTPLGMPLDPDQAVRAESRKRTWADNVVLISSVSGGSLATAQYVHRLQVDPNDPSRVSLRGQTEVDDLRNSTKGELLYRTAGLAEAELNKFPAKQANNDSNANDALKHELREVVPGELTPCALRDNYRLLVEKQKTLREELLEKLKKGESPVKNEKDMDKVDLNGRFAALNQAISRIRSEEVARRLDGKGNRVALTDAENEAMAWVVKNQPFDEMCLDFMAPLLRGTLSPTLGRGDALARFWTNRFGWDNATNFNGYRGKVLENNYQPHHPLVLFNTCNVALGSRVVIGFPPVPDDLLSKAEVGGRSSRARPKPLNEVAPDFRVSLARAVRLSSNFPFGFRVSEVEVKSKEVNPKDVPQNIHMLDGGVVDVSEVEVKSKKVNPKDVPQNIHMLDGGVVDSTGLDTIYELFRALQWHAITGDPPYRDKAHEILEELRKRGVVLLEIDAGAKPSETTPSGYDPFGGPRESYQAMANASYTNAELVKRFYIEEVRALLDRGFEASPTTAETSRAANRDRPATTVAHLTVQCNHYLPEEKQPGEEVMTAWALGPNDKALVVQRFLLALEIWDQDSQIAVLGIRHNLRKYDDRKQQALLDKIFTLDDRSKGLAQDLADRGKMKQTQQRASQGRKEASRLQAEAADGPTEAAAKAVVSKFDKIQKVAKVLEENPDANPRIARDLVKGMHFLDEPQIQVALELDKRLPHPMEPVADPQSVFDLSVRSSKALAEPPRR